MRVVSVSLFLSVLVACANDSQQCEVVEPEPLPDIDAQLSQLDGLGFDALIDTSYTMLTQRSPEAITQSGIAELQNGTNHLLDDRSQAFVEQTYDLLEGVLARLRAIGRVGLTSTQQVSYDVFEWYLDNRLRERDQRFYSYPVNQGFTAAHNGLSLFLRDLHPIESVGDAEDYVARVRGLALQVDHVLEALAVREARGLIAPRQILQWSLPQIRGTVVSDPTSSWLYTNLATKLDALSLETTERERLLADAARAVECHVNPAYITLGDEVARLIDIAPGRAGLAQYDGGTDYYAHRLRHHTTTELTADEIHQLGLDEIARIHGLMRAHFETLGYPSTETIAELYGRVATDGGLVPESQVVAEYESILDAAEANLDAAFINPPDDELVVIGGSSGGFYVSGTPDGSRPGAFYARVAGPEPRYAMATLAYHEGWPGHHLQISWSQGIELPAMRRYTRFTSYVEGWALYTEQLAAELGWYQDDIYGDLGRLQGEAFRAARLVVDTGLHQRNWNFNEAAQYFADNVGYLRAFADGQIARYTAWPGQSTAYKIGMIRLLAMRERASQALGASFDLRQFHSVVLDQGSVPLDVLDAVVDDWAAAN